VNVHFILPHSKKYCYCMKIKASFYDQSFVVKNVYTTNKNLLENKRKKKGIYLSRALINTSL